MVHTLGQNLQATIWAFTQLPRSMKIGLVFALLIFLVAFYASAITPIIFNFYIIPNIEKRFGKKLERDPLYRYIFLSSWMLPQNEVAIYITRGLYDKIFKGEVGLPKKRNRYALKKLGFTIQDATKFETFMSLSIVISWFVIGLCGLIVIIMSQIYPQYFQ